MSEIFGNCAFCNKFIDEIFSTETNSSYDISLWLSLCKVLRVTPNESHLNTFPSCRLCNECHDLALETSETLSKLEELSHKVRSILRKTEIEVRESGKLSHCEWLRKFLCTNLQCGEEENQVVIEVLPIWEEDFQADDNDYDSQLTPANPLDEEATKTIHTEISVNVVRTDASDDSVRAEGVQSSEPEPAANKFRTFTVQGYELKDLEVKLERLSQTYIFNAIINQHSSNLGCREGEHGNDKEEDDEPWKDENSTDISSEDDYQPPRKNQNKKKKPGVSKEREDKACHESKQLKCEVCSKDFPNERLRKQHRDKEHPLSCSVCGKLYTNARLCRRHVKRHEKDKICTQCGKTFTFNYELRDHERVHSEDLRGSLTCKSCDLSFDSWSAIVQHRKKEHPEDVNADDEKHKCHICEKILRSSLALRRHMESHQERNLPCEVCGMSFSGILGLKTHMKRHEKNRICEDCGKSFTFDFELRDHRELNHIRDDERAKARCKPCNVTFGSWSALRQHRTLEHPEDMTDEQEEENQCKVCGRIVDSSHELVVHMRVHKKGLLRHICEACGKGFSHLSSLKSHISMKHASSTEKNSLTCEFCGQTLYSRIQLLKHIRSNHQEKKHVCETCGKRFVETRDFKRHLSTHTKEKPFTCDLCGKGVTDLQNHQVSCIENRSTEEKHYKCSHCDKTFYQELSLKRHEYIHLNPDRFECEVCHKKFRLNCFLVQHRRSHFPEESIPCSICSARFKLRSELKWHMEYEHLGSRDKCSICGYEAKSRVLFRQHERMHKVGRQYECDLCQKKFLTSYHMKRHRQTHQNKRSGSKANDRFE